jgi:hypothetical protein
LPATCVLRAAFLQPGEISVNPVEALTDLGPRQDMCTGQKIFHHAGRCEDAALFGRKADTVPGYLVSLPTAYVAPAKDNLATREPYQPHDGLGKPSAFY